MKKYLSIIDAIKSEYKNKKCFIFDMDGLIFDSERVFMDELNIVMKQKGYELTREIYIGSMGLAGDMLKAYMTGVYGNDFPFEECSKETKERVKNIAVTTGMDIKPEIKETLSFLKESDKLCAVASSNSSDVVYTYIKTAGLSDYFLHLVGGEMTARSKPNPDIFLLACEKCYAAPDESVVLEDSENGIIAAKKAGMSAICIPDLKYPDKKILEMTDILIV